MNNKYFVGQDATSFKAYAKNPPITQIILATDEGAEDAFYAGTEGYSLTVYCPWATQQMANDLLAKAQGFEYQGFEAGMAALPGEAERGDAVTVNGIYGMIADRTLYFNPGMNSDISAPYEEEVNHEFQYVSPIKQDFDRKIGQVHASLTVDLKRISARVDGLNDDYTELSVTLDGVTIKDPSGQTLIKGSSIDTSTIKANSITADKLNLTGSISFGDLDSEVGDKINDAYNTANDNKLPDYIKSTYIDQTEIRSPNIAGGKFLSPNEETWIEMGTDDTSAGYIGYLDLYVDGYSGSTPMFQVYCRSQGSTTRAIAMRATGSDFLVVDANYDIVTPLLTWDFSQAEKVTGLYLTFS